MKGYCMIILVLGMGALTSYWALASEKMSESFSEGSVSLEAAPAAKPSGKLLILSDIHFNPFADPMLFGKLCDADYTQWQSIFESSSDSSYGKYNADTYYRLFKSALQQMKAQNQKPDMIVINGDFLCHNFNCQFENYAKNNDPSCRVSYSPGAKAFIDKTISFVLLMLQDHFPGTPVLPVLGNNDDYCGDYHVQPSGPFLSFFASKSQPMLNSVNSPGFIKTFSKGGYYKASMPWDSNQVFIGINSVFFSTSYADTCNPVKGGDPGNDQLVWLRQTLAACAAKGKKVWLSCHIPPGINVYPSASGPGPCVNPTATMWKSSYNDQYLALINQYHKTIIAGMAGHTHMDDFRLLGTDKAILSFIHITPAVSPVFFNNPAFQELTWDPASMRLLNSVTYRFAGIEPTGKDTWSAEYDYALTYGVKSLDAQSLYGVWQRIGKDPSLRSQYLKYYPVDNGSQPSPWKAYWCGIRFQTSKTFTVCACQ